MKMRQFVNERSEVMTGTGLIFRTADFNSVYMDDSISMENTAVADF
jgi:hypothetical protein